MTKYKCVTCNQKHNQQSSPLLILYDQEHGESSCYSTVPWQIILTYCSSHLVSLLKQPKLLAHLALQRCAVKLKANKKVHVPRVRMSVRPGRATWCCWMVWQSVAWHNSRKPRLIHMANNQDMVRPSLQDGTQRGEKQQENRDSFITACLHTYLQHTHCVYFIVTCQTRETKKYFDIS